MVRLAVAAEQTTFQLASFHAFRRELSDEQICMRHLCGAAMEICSSENTHCNNKLKSSMLLQCRPNSVDIIRALHTSEYHFSTHSSMHLYL